jgi:hypothetical protein
MSASCCEKNSDELFRFARSYLSTAFPTPIKMDVLEMFRWFSLLLIRNQRIPQLENT